ncbi:hypothetical protein ACROYT_G020873 [Oculina patagonica]
MGCAASSISQKKCLGKPPIVATFLLTKNQKELIRHSWKLLQKRRTEIGVKVFLRIFEKDPALQNMFTEFRELKIEELARTRELHGHTERVMRAVENCVNAMDDPDSLKAYLTELGRRHVYRSAKPSVGNLHLISMALISTFQETIPTEWLPEVAAAWELLLNYFVLMLKEGIRSSV